MKKRAVGYIRVSTQAKEGESLKTQEKQISDFIKNKKGWESVKIYSDKARSGSTDVGRSQFQQMIQRAKKGEFQGIVFSRLSRFARNAGDFLHHRDMLRESGVELFSVKENIDPTTPSGKLMMGLMAIIAEWEREMMAEQMGENKMALWREGKINMGQPPLGYDWDRKERELVIVPEEKEIFHRTHKLKPPEEHIISSVPAIIDKPIWDKLQKRTAFNRRKSKRTSAAAELCWLRDSLKCGGCGAKVKHKVGKIRRTGGKHTRRYACHWKNTSDKDLKMNARDRCSLPRIPAEQVGIACLVGSDTAIKHGLESGKIEITCGPKSL